MLRGSSIRLLLGFIATSAAYIGLFCFSASAGIDANNPCDPHRKFCGRLTIYIAGAGEMGTPSTDKLTREKLEITSRCILYDFLQFRRVSSDGLPAYSILISSDRVLPNAMRKLPKEVTTLAGYLGSIPMSFDSFERFLQPDSLLDEALDKFAKNESTADLINPEHKTLSKEESRNAVLAHLKIEIVIQAHNEGAYMPAWQNAKQVGTFDNWLVLEGSPIINADLVRRLRQRVGSAVVQVFVSACKGSQIGQTLLSNSQCSGFISATDANTDLVGHVAPMLILDPKNSYSDYKAILKAELLPPNNRSLISTAFVKKEPTGISNAMLVEPALMNNALVTNSTWARDTQGNRDINRINPLLSFAYDSVDQQIEEILATLEAEHIEVDRAERIKTAGFTDELSGLPPIHGGDLNDTSLAKIFSITAILKHEWAQYDDNLTENRAPGFKEAMQQFEDDILKDRALDEVLAKTKAISDHDRRERESEMLTQADALRARIERDGLDTLIERHHQKQIPLSRIFEMLHDLREECHLFEQDISSVAFHRNWYSDELHHTMNRAEDNLVKALDCALLEFFPILRTEALKTKVARIEATASLLYSHKTQVKSADPDALLRTLANQLSCLCDYPVGPAFDRIKDNQVPAAISANSSDEGKKFASH